MARQYWPHHSEVGKRLRFGSVHESGPWKQVIGVVGNVKGASLDAAENPQIYELYPALPPPYGYLVLRTEGPSLVEAHAARESIRVLDSEVTLDKVASMTDVISKSVAAPRFRVILISSFSLLALLLAAMGIYGAIPFAVSRRTRDSEFASRLGRPLALRSLPCSRRRRSSCSSALAWDCWEQPPSAALCARSFLRSCAPRISDPDRLLPARFHRPFSGFAAGRARSLH